MLLVRLLALLLCLLLSSAPVLAESFSGRVSWIYDGDTLQVDGVGKVRLLGIDAPEYQASRRDNFYRRKFGIPPKRLRAIARRATKFNIRLAKGQQVRLVTDQVSHDRHNRLLAYAYLPDGRLLNALLLEEGLVSVFRRFDFSLKDEFFRLEDQARQAQKGLWQN